MLRIVEGNCVSFTSFVTKREDFGYFLFEEDVRPVGCINIDKRDKIVWKLFLYYNKLSKSEYYNVLYDLYLHFFLLQIIPTSLKNYYFHHPDAVLVCQGSLLLKM